MTVPRIVLMVLPLLLANCSVTRREVVYTPPDWPAPLKADIVSAKSRGKSPAVLLVHGGAWHTRDNRWHMRGIARKLAKRGYVVVSPTYRGTPEFRHPAAVEDMNSALRWMRQHAAEEHIDPDRVAVFGYSAGAHLAGLVGMDASNRVRAIVSGGGPLDLTLYQDGELVPTYLGAFGKQIPEKFTAASPVWQVRPGCPPMFLYHGSADKLVPIEHSRRMLAACRKAGVPCELVTVPGKGHISTFLTGNGAVERALDFLDREVKR